MLEFTDNSSEGPIIYIEIVRIELHRVSAALWGMDRLIPAAPNSEIVSLRNDVNEPRIAKTPKDFACLICGMVVDHNDIEIEIGLLTGRAAHRIVKGPLRVSDGKGDDGTKIEVVTNAAGLVVDAWVADRIRINDPGTQLGNDLRHALEHPRVRLNADTGVAYEKNAGLGGVDEFGDTRRR